MKAFSGRETAKCAWANCSAEGKFRAPKNRSLTEYQDFCLKHIRAYNARWNFHAGLAVDEMESEIRSSITWDRPTWKIGGTIPPPYKYRKKILDPLGLGAGTDFDASSKKRAHEPWLYRGYTAAENIALKTLDLAAPVTVESLRRRYMALVKQHHPDTNGGSRDAERRMKIINGAYQTLRASLTSSTT